MSIPLSRFVIACLLALGPAMASVPPSSAAAPATPHIAYRQGWNVYMMNMQGGERRVVTTDGSGYAGVFYPQYQWSPDGKYLLLVRTDGARQSAANTDLLLAKPDGSGLRTLVSGVVLPDFFPSWALDGDRIIFVSAQTFSGGVTHNTVSSVDTAGHTTVLWRYDSRPGCGGGTPVPAEQLRWTEVGPLGIARSMQWSIARHLAVYSASCGSGLNVTDTVTQRTQRLDPAGMAWSSAALSSRGRLAVVSTAPSTGVQTVLVTTPRAGAAYRSVGMGELPTWSPDGQSLYFVRRTPIGELTFNGTEIGPYAAKVYTSAVWSARANGSRPALLLVRDAYGLGPVLSRAGDASMIFSSVDNMTSLAYHISPGHSYSAALLQQYGPQVRIERYVPGTGILTLLRGGGGPAVQP